MLKFHIDIYLLLSILLLGDFFTKVNQDYWSIKRKVGKYISRVSPFVTYLLCEVMIHTIIQARIVCQYAHSFLYRLFAYLFSVTTKGVFTNNGTKKGQGKTIFSLVWNKCWFIVHHGQTIVSPPPLWGPCSSIFVQIEIDFLRLSQYLTLLWSNSSFCLIVISMSGKQLKFLCDGKFYLYYSLPTYFLSTYYVWGLRCIQFQLFEWWHTILQNTFGLCSSLLFGLF